MYLASRQEDSQPHPHIPNLSQTPRTSDLLIIPSHAASNILNKEEYLYMVPNTTKSSVTSAFVNASGERVGVTLLTT